mmetsp:Transcript_21804/g.33719  ORF Transcript_21804/g.33719 Transcript_21804/m.33719 type:complete len:179 (+) Transcript_21804:582-1118(+)
MMDDQGNPKILDFGLSKNTEGNTRLLKSVVGSKLFMAPEILLGEPHTFTCDMWSLGIMLYIMLSGSYPFDTRNLDHEIMETGIIFLPGKWEGISQAAQDLIDELLDKSSINRISASKALEHRWFKQEHADTNIAKNIDSDALYNLIHYRGMSKLRMAALNVFINMLEQKDIEPLRETF